MSYLPQNLPFASGNQYHQAQPVPRWLSTTSEALNLFSLNAVANSAVRIFRIRHNNENFPHTPLGTLNLTHSVPGMRGSLKDQAVIPEALSGNFTAEVVNGRGRSEFELPAVIQYQRVPAPDGIPFFFRIEVK
jgi:hypothetical protein